MAGRKLSEFQRHVVQKLTEHPGEPLVRLAGGFWTWQSCHVDERGVPDWSVTVQTVRAMEQAGVLRRAGRYAADWQDDRELVPRVQR